MILGHTFFNAKAHFQFSSIFQDFLMKNNMLKEDHLTLIWGHCILNLTDQPYYIQASTNQKYDTNKK